ncbi:hypothetical protein R1sor_011028 [Riccia sorocarpa]|uniref:Uncharacterized protein n=1 Tax=Riccia sorocarpa TaxID=122646 RepID=A0ABD3I2G1_9MARC
MLLHPSYLFDPERHELYGWDYILEDFQEYLKVYGEGILGYECDGDELKIWMEKCNDELESIACQNAAVWTLLYKEKALSEKTKNNPLADSTTEENKFFAETGRNLDDTRLGFDTREDVLDDEILDDMRTRAEASTADAIDNENELGGDGIFDESREQPLRPSSGECSNPRPSKVRRTDTTYKTPESELPKYPVTSTSEDPPQASPLSIPNTNLSTNPPDDTIHSSPERRRSGRPLSPVNYKEAF